MKKAGKRNVRKTEIIHFYNKFIDEVTRKNYLKGYYERKRLKLFDNELSRIECDSILDVGGGAGLLVPVLCKHTKALTETDIAPKMVDTAKRRYKNLKNVRIMKADGENLPFPDKSFDVVVSSEAIEHMLKPKKALKEFCRICKKTILITTPNVFNKKSILVRFVKLFHKTKESEQIQDEKVEIYRIKKVLENNGFKITKLKGIYYPFVGERVGNFLEKLNIIPSYASCLFIKAEVER